MKTPLTEAEVESAQRLMDLAFPNGYPESQIHTGYDNKDPYTRKWYAESRWNWENPPVIAELKRTDDGRAAMVTLADDHTGARKAAFRINTGQVYYV